MAQVLTFFGWLLVGVGLTLFVFGHLSMLFVYDWAYVSNALFPSDGSLSSLLAMPVAVAPGGVLLGLGKLMKMFDQRAAAREGADGTADETADEPSDETGGAED